MKSGIAKLLAITLVITCQASASRKNCKCAAPDRGEKTHQGGNEIVTFKESRTYRLVRGTVHDVNGEPVGGVLVEVFDHPDWIILDYLSSRVEQHRIAACKTGPDGSFCLKNISSGRYELRASKDTAWNPSHVYIVLSPRGRRGDRTGIKVQLTVGT